MDTKQTTVATLGVGLIAVNYWTGGQRKAVVGTLWDRSDPAAAHKALLGIAGELLLIGVLTFFAGQSDTLGTGMVAIVVALAILWAVGYYGRTSSGSGVGSPGLTGGGSNFREVST